jgi:hypothetical protein
MSEFTSLLLSSPIIQICILLLTIGVICGQIEISFPGGGGINKKNK